MGAGGAIAGFGMMLDIAGNITEAQAAEREGKATAQALEHNAELKERNANQIDRATAEDERRLRIQNRRVIGGMRADYGASGITLEGSAMDVLEESAAAAEHDALNLRLGGLRKAESAREDAMFDRKKAAYIRKATKFSASKAIFGAGKSALGAYPTISRSYSSGGDGSTYEHDPGYNVSPSHSAGVY